MQQQATLAEDTLDWMSPEVRGYAYNVARANAWKFRGDLDADDLVQEFAIVFMNTKAYWDETRGARTLMTLFKTNVAYRLIDLQRAHGRRGLMGKVRVSEMEQEDVTVVLERGLPSREQDRQSQVDLRMMLEEAPAGVRGFVEAVMSGKTKAEAVRSVTEVPTVFRRSLER